MVTAAGNEALEGHPNVDDYPNLFAVGLPIIIVGSSSSDGQRSDFSQVGPLVSVYSGGEDVRCPENIGYGRTTTSGTSFAAPAVAGLAANLMSDPRWKSRLASGGRSSLAGNMKQLIESLAYSRSPGGPPVIWNGLSWVDEYIKGCGMQGTGVFKRQACGKQAPLSRHSGIVDINERFRISRLS